MSIELDMHYADLDIDAFDWVRFTTDSITRVVSGFAREDVAGETRRLMEDTSAFFRCIESKYGVAGLRRLGVPLTSAQEARHELEAVTPSWAWTSADVRRLTAAQDRRAKDRILSDVVRRAAAVRRPVDPAAGYAEFLAAIDT